MALKFFLDTYALVEIIKGNPHYKGFSSGECCTCILNLYELYYQLLRDFGKEFADQEYKRFSSIKIEIPEESIAHASLFKLKYKKQEISYADALGYMLAREHNLLFVTGDKEFKNIPHVEWVR